MTHRSDLASSQAMPDDPLALVAPELRPVARAFLRSSVTPPLPDETLAQLRKGGPIKLKPLLPDIPVSERRILGPEGAPEVTLYLINTGRDGVRPAILHMHGGGYIAGTAKWLCRDLQELAVELDCAIVSVDYRVAPETRYSGSVALTHRFCYRNEAIASHECYPRLRTGEDILSSAREAKREQVRRSHLVK